MTNHEIMMDNRGETQSKPTNFINKKIAALALTGSMLLGGAGCAESKNIDTSNNTPTSVEDRVESSETKQSVTVTPTETTVKITPPPTETPTPKPTEASLNPEQQEEKDLQKKMELAPDIEGATKVIKEINGLKRVTYERDGEYIGEYKKEVNFVESDGSIKETGVVALIPSEVQKLLDKQLPTSKDGYLMPLATDLADINDLDMVTMTVGTELFNISYPTIQIDCGDNVVDVLNIIPTEFSVMRLYGAEEDCIIFISELNWNANKINDDNKMAFLQTITKKSETTDYLQDESHFTFGDKLAIRNDGLIYQTMGGFTDTDPIANQTFDDLVKINGIPVCLTNNNQ